MQLLIATTNKHKLDEIKKILRLKSINFLSLNDFHGVPNIIENGKTFEENAAKKARIIAKKYKILTLADDSGLEAKALSGRPGIKSARYAGPNPCLASRQATSEKLCKKLLAEMKNKRNRSAQFVCVIAIADPQGIINIARGICKGKITLEMQGENGFGYDPVFMPNGFKKTFAQMSQQMKNKLSHRSKALKSVLPKIINMRKKSAVNCG